MLPLLAALVLQSVVHDSIYALAVDSTKYRNNSFVFLLDDGVVKHEPDGRASRTYRQVVQILKPDGVERWSEFSFSYDVDHQKMTVNWVRVVKPSGEVVSEKPEVSQESDVPAEMGTPTYTHRKVLRLTLGKVAPGVLVDVSYTTEDTAPYRPGDFYSFWRVNPGIPVRRSRLVLDTPVGLTPLVKERNVRFAKSVEVVAGRRLTTWATRDVPEFRPEPFAGDSNGVVASIQIAAPTSWQSIGKWYAVLAKDRDQATPDIRAKVHDLVSGSRTLDDSVKAVHRFVARDVRYVAIELGIGGYQPRAATTVLQSSVGDCKDKATLFISMLHALGVTAFPVLLNSGGDVDRSIPTIAQFDHAIAVLDRPAGRTFVDLTASLEPYGMVPPSDQGQFALVVHPDGRTEEVTIESDNPATATTHITVSGVVDTSGYLNGRLEMNVGGRIASIFRNVFASELDSTQRAEFAKNVASSVYPEVEGDSLTVIDKGDLGGNPHFSVRLRHARAAQRAGNAAIMALPFSRGLTDLTPVITDIETHQPRLFTIDVAAVSASLSSEAKFDFELPAGWRADLPKPVTLDGLFGTVTSTAVQDGRVLKVVRLQGGKKGTLPPEKVAELLSWLKQVTAANREYASIAIITRS
ncbi:MAG: DUF3857 and transglutaminase domain-containing protein [Gemmatimonadota bacterium]